MTRRIFEVEAVKRLGEQIGYGHLMSLASALWRRKLVKDCGEGFASGAFVPILRGLIVGEWTENVEKEIEIYDGIVNSVLGE